MFATSQLFLAIILAISASAHLDGDCSPQPAGVSQPQYQSSPDTPQAFVANPAFAAAANGASTPSGFSLAFQNQQASASAPGYLGLDQLSSYDPSYCASRCATGWPGCDSFDIYFERDATLDPGANCTNPPSLTYIRCAYFSSCITASEATNTGQLCADFHVVVAGANGYTSNQQCSSPSTTTTTTASTTTTPTTTTSASTTGSSSATTTTQTTTTSASTTSSSSATTTTSSSSSSSTTTSSSSSSTTTTANTSSSSSLSTTKATTATTFTTSTRSSTTKTTSTCTTTRAATTPPSPPSPPKQPQPPPSPPKQPQPPPSPPKQPQPPPSPPKQPQPPPSPPKQPQPPLSPPKQPQPPQQGGNGWGDQGGWKFSLPKIELPNFGWNGF